MSETRNLVCPVCSSVNRVATDRDALEGKCGRCGSPLFTGEPVQADTAQFDRQIARSDIPVVVDFWAEWCGPCRAMAPIYAETAEALEPRLRFLKLDTEAHPEVSARYGIRGIPTLMVFKHGKVLAQQAGLVDRGTLTRWLTPHLG